MFLLPAGALARRLSRSYGEVQGISRELRINERIRAREVRLIDSDGTQLGITPLDDALERAYGKELDLVEVAPDAKPSVCRIMDYGKFKYEQSKREREARKKQRSTTVKEVKMRPNIDQHDFDVKLRNAVRFLEAGDKVKATIMFRGREIVHPDLGRKVLMRLASSVEGLCNVERLPRVEGRNMIMILAPRSGAGERTVRGEVEDAKNEDS